MNLPNSTEGNWSRRFAKATGREIRGERLRALTDAWDRPPKRELDNIHIGAGQRMKRRLYFALLLFFGAIALLASTSSVRAEAPEVLKVEPPSWWAGHSINPVRILIRGRNLQSASVRALCTGIRTRAARVNEAGTYIFVDLLVARQAKPGACRLEVTNANGSTDATFAVL